MNEEIGNPELFTGRKKEMKLLMDWVDLVKIKAGRSKALLARKRRGKTALLQRFYNIIYTRGDTRMVPFYFRAPEERINMRAFVILFYKTFILQYLAFKQRKPLTFNNSIPLSEIPELCGDDSEISTHVRRIQVLLNEEDLSIVWNAIREAPHDIAAARDERIIQIIDEFQFMNQNVTRDGETVDMCSAYQKTAESKVSPQIISGSYVGRLEEIIQRMVARYVTFTMGPLSHEEAMATVYTYARIYNRTIDPEQAAYLAELCHYDSFYIACVLNSMYEWEGPVTPATARRIMDYETGVNTGEISRLWSEYINSAVSRINNVNAKKIILFLAKHHEQQFTPYEIRKNLKLDLSDAEISDRLQQMRKADIIARGDTGIHYRGLGDPLFELVFRRFFEAEVEDVDAQTLEAEYEARFKKLKHQMDNLKGLACEEKMRYYFAQAGKNRVSLSKISLTSHEEPLPELGPFATIRKLSLHPNQNQRVEIDLYARADHPDDPDLAIEIKNWDRRVTAAEVDKFIADAKDAASILDRPAVFIFYSESGFTDKQPARLAADNILACDASMLHHFHD
ncbi:MAG: hypothetical protein QNK37_22065 [Acidobacteriota bacterium]|nr:hypothetical protein [Acidobacteriota bacterium]